MESEVNRNIEEQLSAFLDGELPPDELQLLVRRLERNEEHRATLARYASIGGALRNDQSQQLANQLHTKVMSALEEDRAPADSVSDTAASMTRQSWFKPAVAAALSALAVVAILNANLVPQTSTDVIQQAAIDTQAEPSPGANSAQSGSASPRARISNDRMLSYLVSHGEHAASFQGAMTGSRVFVQQASFEE